MAYQADRLTVSAAPRENGRAVLFRESSIGKAERWVLEFARAHAEPHQRPGRWHPTWITPRIMRVHAEAYDAGYTHSFEVWN